MAFKEIFSLSFGGMGVKFVSFCVSNMMLYVGNTLIGNTIGIAPNSLYAIYVVSVLVNFPLTALRAKMIDTARNKKGKYRPYILSMGLPTAIISVAFTWMPYASMSSLMKCIVVLAFNIALSFFYNFYTDSYESLINVLSPNTIERSDVCSFKTIVDCLAPSLGNIFLPLLARMITGENTLYDMRVYRVLYPIFIIGGFALSMLIYANTEEKIVQAKTHAARMRFIDALLAVAKNKYFWIISCAAWLGFLEGAYGNILGWLYNYQHACSAGGYSLITAITGNASLWPMMFAPLLIRSMGKRNMLIYANIANIFFILLMYPVLHYGELQNIIWIFTVCIFVNSFATTLGGILNPSLNADIRDYQHYITGERIDGMFVAVGLIGSLIGLATSFVLPAIYEEAGLNTSVLTQIAQRLPDIDTTNVYDVLYDTSYFRSISSVLILASAIGAVMNVIPFFFYDLTETKQKAMITVLKIRALFEDYGNNALSDEALVEAIDMIEEANAYIGRESVRLSKEGIRAARKKHDKELVRQTKRAYKDDKLTNEKIVVAQYVVKEMEKFDTAAVQNDVARAQMIVNDGIAGVASLESIPAKVLKALPKTTETEREYRRLAMYKAKQEKYAKNAISRHYPNGLPEEIDESQLSLLFGAEDKTDALLKEVYTALAHAKDKKDRARTTELKAEIAGLKEQKDRIGQEIKDANKQYSLYNVAAKPYLDAKKMLIQQENYRHYEDIKSRYEESKKRAEADRLAKEEAAVREKAEKEAYAQQLKEEKKLAKAAKKEDSKTEKEARAKSKDDKEDRKINK